jgi:hypothetical protein
MHRARQARAYAAAGEIDQAATVGLRALGSGRHTNSARLLRELARLDNDLAASHSGQVAADFRSRLTEMIPRQA